MANFMRTFLFSLFCLISAVAFAQQEQQELSPEEMAAKEVELWETELGLTPSQSFFVDSVLCANYTGLKEEFEGMRAAGMQSNDTFTSIREKWLNKNIAALKLILDEQQYIKYLKYIGRGKEYKKGKDGLYYKKDELEKEKKKKK